MTFRQAPQQSQFIDKKGLWLPELFDCLLLILKQVRAFGVGQFTRLTLLINSDVGQ